MFMIYNFYKEGIMKLGFVDVGVGMSQYGAVEMAKKGNNYNDIIGFYFPGTNIEKIK